MQIQKETGASSWFGFSLVLRDESRISRSALVATLAENEIECRPVVSGNFLKNIEILEYFDYEIHGTMDNANYVDQNGLFVGNHHVDIRREIDFLFSTIAKSL